MVTKKKGSKKKKQKNDIEILKSFFCCMTDGLTDKVKCILDARKPKVSCVMSKNTSKKKE